MKGMTSFFSGVLSVAIFVSLPLSATANTTKKKSVVKPVPKQTLNAINAKAERVVLFYQKTTPKFGYNEDSVKALDQAVQLFVTVPRTVKQKSDFVQDYGSFYGQTLIKLFGGKWVYWDGAMAIRQKNDVIAYPYASLQSAISKTQQKSIYRDMAIYKKLSSMSKAQIAKISESKSK